MLLAGCALLGAGVAGVARVDAPLRAAATEQRLPAVHDDLDVTWDRHDRDCPPRQPERT